jgi:hypothetical protein
MDEVKVVALECSVSFYDGFESMPSDVIDAARIFEAYLREPIHEPLPEETGIDPDTIEDGLSPVDRQALSLGLDTFERAFQAGKSNVKPRDGTIEPIRAGDLERILGIDPQNVP